MQGAHCERMKPASTRLLSKGKYLSWLIASCALLPSGARADVLEIGHNGAVWITGQPASGQPHALPSYATPGAEAQSEAAPHVGSSSYTEVRAGAGPAIWQSYIASLAAKYDISPELLEAVVWQESRWNTNAVSPAGARGLAQLMPATARQLGVDPANPHANLEGGARYLRMQLDKFDGNIENALAAYNAGPGRVVRAGGVPLIRETREYVASIMARLSQPVRR